MKLQFDDIQATMPKSRKRGKWHTIRYNNRDYQARLIIDHKGRGQAEAYYNVHSERYKVHEKQKELLRYTKEKLKEAENGDIEED